MPQGSFYFNLRQDISIRNIASIQRGLVLLARINTNKIAALEKMQEKMLRDIAENANNIAALEINEELLLLKIDYIFKSFWRATSSVTMENAPPPITIEVQFEDELS